MRKVFISFKDEKGKVISGNFDLILETANFVKIGSESNTLTIPFHRILKIKEANNTTIRREP